MEFELSIASYRATLFLLKIFSKRSLLDLGSYRESVIFILLSKAEWTEHHIFNSISGVVIFKLKTFMIYSEKVDLLLILL